MSDHIKTTGTDYQKTITVDSIFGKIEVTYVPEAPQVFHELFEAGTPEMVPSHYVATMLDGDFNGWSKNDLTRKTAVKGLIVEISARYGYDLIAD